MRKQGLTRLVKETAARLGFDNCGIAKAGALDEDAKRLEHWLNQGMQGKMNYMENHFDMRIDPTKLLPGARSVITLLHNYYPEEKQPENLPQISKYAYGKDYHDVIRKKLNSFMDALRKEVGDIVARGFVDSAPVLERSWAVRSGLGWVGKNGNLISKKSGSFFFIATLITDLELEYDDIFNADHCGTCNKCVESCPTNAILPDKVINGSRCISYFTIELKNENFPDTLKEKFGNWAFGCDICQDVCPWNRFAKPTGEPDYHPKAEILHFTEKDWEELEEDSFNSIFKDSPIKRTKLQGMKRNIRFIKK